MLSMLWVVGHGTYFMTAVGQKIRRLSFDSVEGTAGATWRRLASMDGGHLDGLATAAQLIAVLQSCKQLEEAMKARQGGGGAKSGRYMKHGASAAPPAPFRRLRRRFFLFFSSFFILLSRCE